MQDGKAEKSRAHSAPNVSSRHWLATTTTNTPQSSAKTLPCSVRTKASTAMLPPRGCHVWLPAAWRPERLGPRHEKQLHTRLSGRAFGILSIPLAKLAIAARFPVSHLLHRPICPRTVPSCPTCVLPMSTAAPATSSVPPLQWRHYPANHRGSTACIGLGSLACSPAMVDEQTTLLVISYTR